MIATNQHETVICEVIVYINFVIALQRLNPFQYGQFPYSYHTHNWHAKRKKNRRAVVRNIVIS